MTNMLAHISTVHRRDDSRIVSKMASTLNERDNAHLIVFVQDGLPDEINSDGLEIRNTGPRLPRLWRMTIGCWRMFRSVIHAKSEVIHFHDPELLPWALLLKFTGRKVIYDVHEDYPEALKYNLNIPYPIRILMPKVVWLIEYLGGVAFDGVVTATPKFESSRLVSTTLCPTVLMI
jgi:hypothetical protein